MPKPEPQEDSFPKVTKDTLDALEQLYPLRSPKFTDTEREIWAQVGRREVITLLRNKFNEQHGQ